MLPLGRRACESTHFYLYFSVVESVSICMQLSLFANTNQYNGNKIVINNCYLYPASELALQKTLLTFFYSGKHFRLKSFLYNQLLIQLQISLGPILIILFIIPEFNYFIKKTRYFVPSLHIYLHQKIKKLI